MFLIGVDVTRTDATAAFAIGQLTAQTTSDGVKIYKYVLFNNGVGNVAAVANNVAYYYAPSGTSTGVVTVTSDLSDSAEIGAGVFAAAPADGEYCWLQVTGKATLNTALTAGADGDPLTPTGSTDGTLDVTAASTDHICAIAVDASAKIVLCEFPL
jgi:hypothetical protein